MAKVRSDEALRSRTLHARRAILIDQPPSVKHELLTLKCHPPHEIALIRLRPKSAWTARPPEHLEQTTRACRLHAKGSRAAGRVRETDEIENMADRGICETIADERTAIKSILLPLYNRMLRMSLAQSNLPPQRKVGGGNKTGKSLSKTLDPAPEPAPEHGRPLRSKETIATPRGPKHESVKPIKKQSGSKP